MISRGKVARRAASIRTLTARARPPYGSRQRRRLRGTLAPGLPGRRRRHALEAPSHRGGRGAVEPQHDLRRAAHAFGGGEEGAVLELRPEPLGAELPSLTARQGEKHAAGLDQARPHPGSEMKADRRRLGAAVRAGRRERILAVEAVAPSRQPPAPRVGEPEFAVSAMAGAPGPRPFLPPP